MSNNIRIYVSFISQILKQAINQVIETQVGADFVKEKRTAHIVITDNVREILDNYKTDKNYIFLAEKEEDIFLKRKNVTIINTLDLIAIIQIIYKIKEQIKQPFDETVTHEIKSGSPWILIVDNSNANLDAAEQQLGSRYNLVLTNGYDQARSVLKLHKFDFALIDLQMPVSTACELTDEAISELIDTKFPYGLLILLQACSNGAHSTIITDADHHSDPFSAAFDNYSGRPFIINDKIALLQHAVIKHDNTKDWALALEKLKLYNQN